jgi:hypothetical protein
MEIKTVITWMDWATIVFSFLAMCASGLNWWNNKKQLKPIKIIIEKNGIQDTLPLDIIRKNFTRAEIFGILGAFDKDSNFKIKYTSSREFLNQISDIQESKSDQLIVKIEDKDKFDW